MASEYFVDCLVDAIAFDKDGDLKDVDGEEYRKLRDFVEALGEDWKSILLALPDRAPWTPHGGLLYQPIYWFEADDPETREREFRLFCCDCAERVLPIFEKENPGDDRPRKAIEVARRYAVGEATEEERYQCRAAAYATFLATSSDSDAAYVAAYSIAVTSTATDEAYVAPYFAAKAVESRIKERAEQWKMLVARLCREK